MTDSLSETVVGTPAVSSNRTASFALNVVARPESRLSQLAEEPLSQAPVLLMFHASEAPGVGGVNVSRDKLAAALFVVPLLLPTTTL